MDWFQLLAGFREESYSAAQAQLKISDGRLKSLCESDLNSDPSVRLLGQPNQGLSTVTPRRSASKPHAE